jgi:hypothetical protein
MAGAVQDASRGSHFTDKRLRHGLRWPSTALP